ncbi:phytanoyl-CoA dioxygenase family protein [Polyangium sorediatum]|uniref:Phytanoyl-CoA dioxygenase family protein n=1 Tax=Polyangium sorediatum TaxID=889274 RepID=A0ABT6NVX3_9BACT|nr:phytanoyl-CoA dioxygenase family protein [Polyangium sorediatum]MDI1432458.1 phytanoyl-CoA dioxygenase family protein [Polyangium sorediatum]
MDIGHLVDSYQRDGYLVLRGLFSPSEVQEVAEETAALLERKELMAKNNLRVRWQYHYETCEPVFELFDPVTDIAPRCSAWFHDRRIAHVLEQLFQDHAHPFKDKLIYKPAGAGGYPLHQDFIAWPGFPESFTTVVLAIDAANAENGCIEVFPGAHARGCLAERDGNFHMLSDSVVEGFSPVKLTLDPGDAVVFGAFMPHRSDINRSGSMRRHLLYSYNAERDGKALRDEHYQAFHHYLRTIYGMMGLADLHFR